MHACLLCCPAVTGQEELSGQLVCFKFCPIIKRDFAVVLAAHQHDQQQQQGDVLEKQHQQQEDGSSHSPNSSAQKVGVLACGGSVHGAPPLWSQGHAAALAPALSLGLLCMKGFRSAKLPRRSAPLGWERGGVADKLCTTLLL
jgi:hypothetical protein